MSANGAGDEVPEDISPLAKRGPCPIPKAALRSNNCCWDIPRGKEAPGVGGGGLGAANTDDEAPEGTTVTTAGGPGGGCCWSGAGGVAPLTSCVYNNMSRVG